MKALSFTVTVELKKQSGTVDNIEWAFKIGGVTTNFFLMGMGFRSLSKD